jgi:hypothetical protein
MTNGVNYLTVVFTMVQATLLRLLAFKRRVILDAGFKNLALQYKNSFFGVHLKKCVAIAYFQIPVNRKHNKRCELFNSYLHYSASYASETGGV